MAVTATVEEARDMALEKAQEVIDAWDVCIAAGKTIGTRAITDLKMEEFFEVLMEEFPVAADPKSAPQIFDAGFNALNHVELSKIPDELVPVALTREVLGNHKVLFNVRNVYNSTDFVKRFGPYISGVK